MNHPLADVLDAPWRLKVGADKNFVTNLLNAFGLESHTKISVISRKTDHAARIILLYLSIFDLARGFK